MHQMPSITRSDGSTVTPTVITRGAGSRKAQYKMLTEPVVSPNGDVIESYINTDMKNAGQVLVEKHQGVILLTAHAREEGFVLYRDMCFGRVPGVKASPVHWEIFEYVKNEVANNRRPSVGDLPAEDLYHPHVIELRAGGTDGVERIPKAELDKVLATIRAGAKELDPEKVEARAEEIGMTRPDTKDAPSLDKLVEKGRKSNAH